jgi:hypothetical protein
MIHTLKCPSCAAPLDYADENDRVSIRCPFCNNTVVVPEALRKKENPLGFTMHIKGSPQARPPYLTLIVTVVALAVIIPIIGVIYGLSKAFRTTTNTRVEIPSPQFPKLPAFPAPPSASPTPEGMAKMTLKFGSEGTGPGMFNDSRSIALDGEGRIFIGDYTGGRIQVFDAAGKFITQWMADEEMPLRGLAADRRGTVYVVQRGKISRYEALTGKALGEVAYEGGSGFDDAVALPDGGLLAAWYRGSDDIVRFDAGGRVAKVMRAAISGQSRRSELNMRVAADGLGNVYALGTFNSAVFKFASDGRFLNKFGGSGDQQGQFRAPDAIAVDGHGRVYVSDIHGVQVFDSEGRFIDRFKTDGIAFGMIFNDKNELFVAARSHVMRFELKPPAK